LSPPRLPADRQVTDPKPTGHSRTIRSKDPIYIRKEDRPRGVFYFKICDFRKEFMKRWCYQYG